MKSTNKFLFFYLTFVNSVDINCSIGSENNSYSVVCDNNNYTITFQDTQETFNLVGLENCTKLTLENPPKECMLNNVNLGILGNLFNIDYIAYSVTIKIQEVSVTRIGNDNFKLNNNEVLCVRRQMLCVMQQMLLKMKRKKLIILRWKCLF